MAAEKTGFIPKGDNQDEKTFLGLYWPSSLFTYYSCARLFGYWAQAGQNPAIEWLEKNVVKGKVNGGMSKQARSYWGYLEAAAFTLVATVSFFSEKKHFKRNIYDAIAAERGTNPDEQTIFSIYKSDNPFIRSLRDRFSEQTLTRFPAAFLFAKSVLLGVIGITLNYTLERSIFVESNAYDMLQNMIHEVQRLKVSGDRDVERLYTGLERAVQRTLRDNHRVALTDEQLSINKPVFERLTRNILNDTLHVKDAVYILGQIANNPHSTARLLKEMDSIELVGLKGFAREKWKAGHSVHMANLPQANIKRSFVQMVEKPANPQHGVL